MVDRWKLLQHTAQAKKDLESFVYAAPEYKQMWYEALVADLNLIEMVANDE